MRAVAEAQREDGLKRSMFEGGAAEEQERMGRTTQNGFRLLVIRTV